MLQTEVLRSPPPSRPIYMCIERFWMLLYKELSLKLCCYNCSKTPHIPPSSLICLSYVLYLISNLQLQTHRKCMTIVLIRAPRYASWFNNLVIRISFSFYLG